MMYALMAALTLLAALWLTRPLWRDGTTAGIGRARANVVAYRTRLAELASDVAAGVVPPDEAAALRRELDARLLADAGTPEGVVMTRPPRAWLLALAMTAFLAVFAGTWYWQAGTWRTDAQIARAATGPAATDLANADVPPEVAGMVAKLQARLKAQPEDAEGWALLGRSMFVMQRYGDAAEAYDKANRLSRDSNPEWLTDQGEALALSRDRDLLGRPAALFNAALKVQPDYGKALWYAGMAAAQDGDLATARRQWTALSQQELPPQIRETLTARLAELDHMGSNGQVPVAAGAAAPAPAPVATASLPPSAAASAASAPAPAAGVTLTVKIRLRPELAAKAKPDQVLFVFAKAANGPPMPLAVQRLPGATLPMTLTLDDSMAMAPAFRLSQFKDWVITARLSSTGGAQAQPGDLQGSRSVSASQAGQPVDVEISEVVGG